MSKIMATIVKGEKLYSITDSANKLVILVKAIKELKNSAPNNTTKIIAAVTAVSCITSIKSMKEKPLLKAAMIPVPAAPIAAPSVGVNQPRYIPPMTNRKIRATCQISLNKMKRVFQSTNIFLGPESGKILTKTAIAII